MDSNDDDLLPQILTQTEKTFQSHNKPNQFKGTQ